MMDDMFPCEPIPYTKEGKNEFDRIFGHGEYDSTKHSDTWNKALIRVSEKDKKYTCFICEEDYRKRDVRELTANQFICNECDDIVSEGITK